MSIEEITTINQLANRLSNNTYSNEKIEALQELQSLSRSIPNLVGELALNKVLDFLQDQGNTEEYQEALDLISRLIKCRDKEISYNNTNIILNDISTIELLLDLLNHDDLTVGVMTSQILMEIHLCNGNKLEAQIQQCPDAMNKLLQRLPDSSREEVRNQAIVLIQQLTSSNEEMKKTVAFNEGFEILFNIIQHEGGSSETGLVTQDCIHICKNILTNSETCQRLFFAMGGNEWIIRLADFFDPNLLENMNKSSFNAAFLMDDMINDQNNSDNDKQTNENNIVSSDCWYEDSTRYSCAILALAALVSALCIYNASHQKQVACGTSIVLSSVTHWIARRGPSDLVYASLYLLYRLVDNNADIGLVLSNATVKVNPVLPRKNFPVDIEQPTLHFSWKPVPTDDRRFISLLALLAERYLYPCDVWTPSSSLTSKAFDAIVSYDDFITTGSSSNTTTNTTIDSNEKATRNFSQLCLVVLENILCSNNTISDLIVQYVLAPPPPPEIDIGPSEQLESMKPLGTQVLKVLLEGCHKILETGSYSNNSIATVTYRNEIDIVERAANFLSIVFINGSQLGKELCTAITTAHTTVNVSMLSSVSAGSSAGSHKPLLPMLLSIASRCTRLPGGIGYPVLVSLLRMLACIASGCEFAAKQMLEDPANLFVVDLATIASESTGVPPLVQVAACFFLGNCFEALKNTHNTSNSSSDDSTLTRKSFLLMIDSRIGLTRFTELLRKPIASKNMMHKALIQSYATIFITNKFKEFYQKQVEAIRNGIFEFYTGSNSNSTEGMLLGDATQQEIIKMQKEKIEELERRLINYETNSSPTTYATIMNDDVDNTLKEVSVTTIVEIEETDSAAASLAIAKEKLVQLQLELQHNKDELTNTLQLLSIANSTITNLEEDLNAERITTKEYVESLSSSFHKELEEYKDMKSLLEVNENEIVDLKQTILNDHDIKKQLKDTVTQKDTEIEALLEELQKIPANESQIIIDNEKKMKDLELRNSELTQQLWTVESEIEKNIQQKLSELSLSTHNNDNEIDITSIIDVVDNLVVTLQIITDMDEDYEKMKDTECYSITQRVNMIESVIQQVSEALSNAIGECSDIAEHADIYDLQGNEGSILRFLDCCRKLRTSLYDSYQNNQLFDQYKLETDLLKTQLDDYEKIKRDLEEQIYINMDNISQLTTKNQCILEQNNKLMLDYESFKCNAKQILLTVSNQNNVKYNELLTKNNELTIAYNTIKNDYDTIKNDYDTIIPTQNTSNVVKEQAQMIELTQQVHHLRSEESRMAHLINTLTFEKDQAIKDLQENKELVYTTTSLLDRNKLELSSSIEAFSLEKQQLLQLIKDLEVKNNDITIVLDQFKHQSSIEIEQKIVDIHQNYQSDIKKLMEEKENIIENHKLYSDEAWKATMIQISHMQNELDSAKLATDALLSIERNSWENKITALTLEIESLQQELKQEKISLFKVEQIRKVSKLESDQQIDLMNRENSQLFNLAEELKIEIMNKDKVIIARDEDLIAEQENCASLLIKNEELYYQISELNRSIEIASNEIKLLKQLHADDVVRLQGCIDVEKANKVQLQAMYSSPEALHTQTQELKRLTSQIDTISKDLQSKEQQLQNITTQLRRREGEFAGISATIEDLKSEIEQYRIQNEQLNDKLIYATKLSNDYEKSLKTMKEEFNIKEQEVFSLKRILLAFESSNNSIDNNNLSENILSTPNRTSPLSSDVINKNHNSSINNNAISNTNIANTKLGFAIPHNPMTPISNNMKGMNHSYIDNSNAILMNTNTTTSNTTSTNSKNMSNMDLIRWNHSSHKASLLNQMSPATKQAAILNAELIKERHKFNTLQEQHSDLLGLLAQQDTELSVFRDTIHQKLGTSELISAEEYAMRTSIDLYGSYTKFRYDL